MDTTNSQTLLNEAKQLYKAGEYTQALPKFEALLEHDPNNVVALMYQADILCEFNHTRQSLSIAQKALAIEPKNPMILSLMSKIFNKLCDFESSMRYAKRAYKLAPQNPLVLKAYGSALENAKDATPLIAKIVPQLLATKDVESDNIAAIALYSVGKTHEAIRTLRAGIRRFLATTKSPPPPNQARFIDGAVQANSACN